MKEFIEKLIGRLEEIHKLQIKSNGKLYRTIPYDEVSNIVNQLAEEYKDKLVSKDEVGYMLDTIEMRGDETWMDYYRKALKGLCELSGGEYNNGWIPCSERLPEKDMLCLATFESGNVDKIQYLASKKWWNGEMGDNRVIAWKPLPAPYQPKGE